MPYGSEWHLLRYLGWHRHLLHQRIREATGGDVLDWIDHRWNPGGIPAYFDGPKLDKEWKGLDFMTSDMLAKKQWPAFWPQRGNVQNWDAVGWLRFDTQIDLLLVEAKAHVGELQSSCGAEEHGGLPTIRDAVDKAKIAFGVPTHSDWLQPYYQFCNRLAILDFLMRHGVGARLLFVYFCGDINPNGRCPQTETEWGPALQAMQQHVGLNGQSALETRVHKLFLPVLDNDRR